MGEQAHHWLPDLATFLLMPWSFSRLPATDTYLCGFSSFPSVAEPTASFQTASLKQLFFSLPSIVFSFLEALQVLCPICVLLLGQNLTEKP